MRILMLDNEFPPLGGGTGVVNFHLLKEFAKQPDVWVDLVTSSRTSSTYEQEVFEKRIRIFKVPVGNRNIHHSTGIELMRYACRGYLRSQSLIKKHSYDMSFAFAGVPAGAISYTLKRQAGLPYILSLQGPDVPGFEARYNLIYPVLKPLLRQIWRNAAVVTALSQENQHLALKTVPDLPIPVVYNGVDTNVFFPSESESSCIRLLCVGRLIERKSQHHLLEALAYLKRCRPDLPLQLRLVGTGDAERMLIDKAHDLGISHAVQFDGFIPREEMPEIYRKADIFILPSQNEGMSIALLEALASGLSAIVTDTGGTAELVKPGVNGLVIQWGNIQDLAEAIEKLAEDRSLRCQMGVASRKVAAGFAWENIARQTLDLCEFALRGG